ncbi:hypothetical protein [Microcoleus sp. D2_18a_D3]|uniref:hypothetical protein n=1 Tax=Microcoleus sp. D2_18a_D3 TaxID=3055330 RepID=UPI002FCF9DF4
MNLMFQSVLTDFCYETGISIPGGLWVNAWELITGLTVGEFENQIYNQNPKIPCKNT